MENMLRTLYELNEKYHDTKEHVVWLATTIYLALSLLVIRHSNVLLSLTSEWGGLILLFFVFLSTFLFIAGQTWQKCISVVKTAKFHELIEKLDDASQVTYQTIIKETDPGRFDRRDVKFFREGWPGVLILFAISVFWVAQIVCLAKQSFLVCLWLSNIVIVIGSFVVVIIASILFLRRLRIGRKDDADFLRSFRKAGYKFALRLRLESTKSSFRWELRPTIEEILDHAMRDIKSSVQRQTRKKRRGQDQVPAD